MNISNRLKGCLYAGAIGDCIGGVFENQPDMNVALLELPWRISDDTQMTLATCEAIIDHGAPDPASIAEHFVQWFGQRRITGIGASTLKALTELQAGGHWALVGRRGEYAAGNGAAMRIAPLAFCTSDKIMVADVVRITHRNDEAYAGALAIFEGITCAIRGQWVPGRPLIPLLIDKIPDTRVRDRLIELGNADCSIAEAGRVYGNTGFAADSVPLAIYAAQRIGQMNLHDVFQELILAGGDTDTTCSMAGHVAGGLIGYDALPGELLQRFSLVSEAELLDEIAEQFIDLLGRQGHL